MNNLKITVLMSVYNEKEKDLRQAIESILNQTYKEFEFLIINDGKDIKVDEIIKSYNDDRINLIHNAENIGLARSLNKGLKIAKGEYIVRMDSDDISHPKRIEQQLDFIENHKEYSIVSGRANIFNEEGIYLTTNRSGEISKEDFIKGTPFIHPTMIIRKKDINSIGGYPEYRRCQDYAMAMNMYANGYKGYIMNDILIDYRMNSEGYKKKKFKHRVNEAKIRLVYYRKLKMKWYSYIYVFKPIFIGLIPKKILKLYHEKHRRK